MDTLAPMPSTGCCLCGSSSDAAVDPGRRRLLGWSLFAGATLPLGASALASRPAAGAFPHALKDAERYVVASGAALVERRGELALLPGAQLVIAQDRIEAVLAAGAPVPLGLPRLDATRHLLLPGFISGHTHVAGGSVTRGLIETGRSFARPLQLADELTDTELEALTTWNLAELLLSGCTTQVEMSLSLRQAEAYVKAATRLGARGFPGGMVPSIGRLFPIWFRRDDQVLRDAEAGTLAEIANNLAFARRHQGVADGRINPMMTLHAADTQTPATMAAAAAAARELRTGLHLHLSQSRRETDTVRRLWGMTPTEWCRSVGLLDGPLFGAHCEGLDFAVDAPLLAAAGAVYAHCPSAGGAGASSQPYPEALAAGLRVNIGIDTHSNDYVENLKLAVFYGRTRHRLLSGSSALPLQRPDVLTAVDGATRVAADGLRRPDLGRIAPGAKADLVAIDVTGPLVGAGAFPPEPLNHLLYANGTAVRHVIIDGRPCVLDGALVGADVAAIEAEAGAAVRRLWSLLASEGYFRESG